MVQHDWDGNMAFLHRTSTAKFTPDAKSWRHVDYVSASLSHQQAHQVVNNGDGWMLGQVNLQFERHCCGLTNPTDQAMEKAKRLYLKTKKGCSIHQCTISTNADGIPVLAFPPEIAFAKSNASQVVRMMDELYAVMQQVPSL